MITADHLVAPYRPPAPLSPAVAPPDVSSPVARVAIYMHDLAGGGVERQVITLAHALQANGLSVTLVLHQMRGELREMIPAGIRVADLRSRRTLHDVPRLVRFLRRERPDILLSNLDHNNVAAVLANQLAATGTRIVICQHNAIAGSFAAGLGWSYRAIPLIYRVISPFIDTAVAVSQGIADELHILANIPRHKIKVIHNAVIGEDFHARAGQPVAHRWLNDRKVPVFVTAGRLVALKDHQSLLRAFALYRRSRQGRLLVLGTGPLLDDLETLADELGIADTVEFLGFKENPLPYFREAAAFVLSSYSEGFGNVLVEAMGCGTPIISTDCNHGPAEILDRGRYGVLVPPRCPQALAEAMGTVGDLRGLWPSELLQARAAEFSTTACVDAYVGLFRSLAPSAANEQSPHHHQVFDRGQTLPGRARVVER